MPETPIESLSDRFLAHHLAFNPVDATFMGLSGFDYDLPKAGPDAEAEERDALKSFSRALEAAPIADSSRGRLDAALLRAAIAHAGAALDVWPRFSQPSWYTGEAAFGIISLLLVQPHVNLHEALRRRLEAIPAFLSAGAAALEDRRTPSDWRARARRECAAMQRLMADLKKHPLWNESMAAAAARAAASAQDFSRVHDRLPQRDPACGRDYLALLMRDVHALPWMLQEACALAREAFVRLGEKIAAHPARDALPQAPVEPSELPAAYRLWHERASERAAHLVAPAHDYGLAFEPLPEWARGIAGELYCLSYRCPPALAAGAGSIYWTAPIAQPHSVIKQTHAIHHGSIGHHTQNARARAAAPPLAQLAGTDCASGIAFLAAGTMVEGWSCYATELAAEIDGFYTPEDELASLLAQRRNAASVLADINLHTGAWSLDEMRAFYRDEAGFPEARIWTETTRNSIFPATRLMYFLGTLQIKELRREFGGAPKTFHDELLSHGHVPVALAAREMRAARAR